MDDMLLMAVNWSEIIQARDTTIHVLESLGFIVNYRKSVLDPSTRMEFLGVVVDSVEMTMSIPQSKMQKLMDLCQKALSQPTMTMRKLAKVLGTLKATAPGFSWAPLQTRYLQQILVQGTKQGLSYEAKVTLSEEATWELKWWLDNMRLQNGKSLSVNPPDLFISTDAAKGKRGGWGAECHGSRTGGPWTNSEKNLHINVLELIAAELGLRTFTKGMFGIAVHLKMDNTAALGNIVKMGGTKNLDMIHISKRIWTYLLDNKIDLDVEYIPSKLNVEADWESRNWVDSSEWMLNPQVFQQICLRWGYPNMDLFASRVSHQLPDYMSWKPDPGSKGTDALYHSWAGLFPYAFPPFSLIGRVLNKVMKHNIRLILVTPVWVTQTWYPQLLDMIIQEPLMLPNRLNVLRNPQGLNHPLIENSSMRLAAWLISGNSQEHNQFLTRLPCSSRMLDPQGLEEITSRPGTSLVAGVLTDKMIRFTMI